MEEHKCGPEHNTEFFDALNEVYNKFPEAADQYAVICIDHETDIMKIDFKKQEGIARMDEGMKKVTIDYQDKPAAEASDEGLASSGLICCKWWRESDSTWTCLQRWDHALTNGGTEPETLKPR